MAAKKKKAKKKPTAPTKRAEAPKAKPAHPTTKAVGSGAARGAKKGKPASKPKGERGSAARAKPSTGKGAGEVRHDKARGASAKSSSDAPSAKGKNPASSAAPKKSATPAGRDGSHEKRGAEKAEARTARSPRSEAGSTPPAARSGRGSARPAVGNVTTAREPTRLVSLPLPTLAPIRRPSVEERASAIEARLAAQPADFRKRYEDSLDMSWIYHDSALEGVVYTFEELRTALAGHAPPVTESSLQPTYDDIRRHKEAIEFVRTSAAQKKLPVTVDVIRKLYLILHPEEGELKTVKYRKDIPQHRLYFHEYAPPDKIAYKVRQVVDWLSDPETRKTRNGVRIAARAHYDLVRVYPFATDSGKVARLFMNLLLMRLGMPPAILHSTERQRYYEALKGSANVVLQMVQEAVENALSSVEKLLDEHETKKRAFVN